MLPFWIWVSSGPLGDGGDHEDREHDPDPVIGKAFDQFHPAGNPENRAERLELVDHGILLARG
jgi:hypothetical protein